MVVNHVFYIDGRIHAKGIWKQDPEPNIWAKMDDNGEYRRMHNGEFKRLYRSPNLVRVIISTRLRWAGYAARMQKGRNHFKILTVNTTGKRFLGVDVRVILEWILKK